jgi:hypothetical protein
LTIARGLARAEVYLVDVNRIWQMGGVSLRQQGWQATFNRIQTTMLEKLSRWLFFSVLFGVVPILASLLYQLSDKATQTYGLAGLIGHGEVLLVTAALCASSAGELFGGSTGRSIWKVIAGGSSTFLLLATTLYFSNISTSFAMASIQKKEATIDAVAVANISTMLFLVSLFTCGWCICLSALEESGSTGGSHDR